MELSALAGNRRLKAQLSQQEGGRGLSHAYIISGPVGSGRHTLGGLLAQAMVCTVPEHQRPCGHCPQCRKAQGGIHPDIAWIAGAGEGKPINVDQVRALRSDAYIRPNEGERKVYILEGADRMNASAQNAMLKLLEEGPAYAAFLFCAETAAALLPTVRSRCVEWKVAGQPETPEMEQARGLCRVLAQGKTLPAAQWLVSLENRRIKREQLQELLQDAWLLTAQALLLQAGKPEDGTLPEEAELLSRSLSSRRLEGLSALLRQYSAECAYNVGAGHVLGALCAQWERLLHATR